MKILFSVLLTLLFSVSYGQIKFDPDSRVIANHGEAKAKELVDYRPNYYNYLVYQLDHTCSIVDKKEAKKAGFSTGKDLKKNGVALNKESIGASDFNYVNWGITPDQEITRYYLLEDGTYIKVLSIRALTNKFRVSPKNTKNLY